jgi:hypothetical protein
LAGSPLVYPFFDEEVGKTKWLPKGGVSLYPTGSTTLRGAYFETVNSSGLRELELIEPTYFAGFNQTFFDQYPGTLARNYAFGIDEKVQAGTYLGAEFIHRDLTRTLPIPVTRIDLDAETLEPIGSGIALLE